jgi:hypothetical protein
MRACAGNFGSCGHPLRNLRLAPATSPRSVCPHQQTSPGDHAGTVKECQEWIHTVQKVRHLTGSNSTASRMGFVDMLILARIMSDDVLDGAYEWAPLARNASHMRAYAQ